MTQEEKAKAYDEAIKRAKEWEGNPAAIDYIFPELKESNDVKIKNKLINFIKTSNEVGGLALHKWEADEMLAWIERQAEHANFRNKIQVGDKVTKNEAGVLVNLSQLKRVAKPADSYCQDCTNRKGCINCENSELRETEQKSADKVEPKFKVGDWVMLDRPVLITKVKDMPYNTHQYWTSDGTWFGDATKSKLWTIQDAKDGDVLKEDSCIFILKKMKFQDIAITHCCLFDDGDFNLSSEICFDVDSTYPATKEQRNLLFQKIEKVGYKWDAENKELKKD